MKSKTTFQSVLDTFRKYALSERDKGDKFERLMLRPRGDICRREGTGSA